MKNNEEKRKKENFNMASTDATTSNVHKDPKEMGPYETPDSSENENAQDGSTANVPDPLDRRVRKTRNALKKSLISLLQKKKITDISVKELADLADVNRATFYLHYKDIYDLLEQSEEDLLSRLYDTVNSYSMEDIRENTHMIFTGIYQLCLDNADIVRILIGENGDIKFLAKMKNLLKEKCLNDWSSILKKQHLEHFDAYFAFLVGGCMSLLQYWFQDGRKETPIELAEITAIFLDRNLG